MNLTPIADYSGYEHCLGVIPTFYHPNGNIYGVAVEKRNSIYQDLSIYVMYPGTPKWILRKRFFGGGQDALTQFTQGGAIIDKYGALIVTTACVPKTDPTRTKTGFQNCWYWEPNFDEPYNLEESPEVATLRSEVEALKAQNASLIQQINALSAKVDSIGTGGTTLTTEQLKAIEWANKARLLPE